MKPGEVITNNENINLNKDSKVTKIKISNSGERPVQVGSHYHFFETNEYLVFDRKLSYGKRLNIPSGTAVRFEPGQSKDVELIEINGLKKIYGFNKKVMMVYLIFFHMIISYQKLNTRLFQKNDNGFQLVWVYLQC